MKVNFKKTRIRIAAALIALYFTICTLGQGATMDDKQWHLQAIDGEMLGQNDAFISINSERTRFTGFTGCNRMHGTIIENGPQTKFNVRGITEMACRNDSAKSIESRLLAELGKVTRMCQDAEFLTLFEGSRIALKFRINKEVPNDENPVRLGSGDWLLRSIGDEEITVAAPTIRFDTEKRSVGGNTGCNVFGGSYSAERDNISVSNIVSTLRACEDPARMSVERRFLDSLQKANRFALIEGKLHIYLDKSILLVFAARQN